jgi:hypothetical protein
MKINLRATKLLLSFACSGLCLAACGTAVMSSKSAEDFSTPLIATYSWFQAINQKNPAALEAHAAPSAKDMMDWNGGDTSQWGTFSDVSCKVLISKPPFASLLCSFDEKGGAPDGADTFWTVSLRREQSGKWLITNYGQG